MDILKILLERSHILAVNASAVQFDIESYNLRINSIDQLRSQLEKLGNREPRKANEEEYLRREATKRRSSADYLVGSFTASSLGCNQLRDCTITSRST